MSQISASTATLTAFFDNQQDAQNAVERLTEAGIPSASIRLVAGAREGAASADRTAEHKGFFEILAEFFMPEEDRYSYAEGLSRGGYLVTVTGLSGDLHATAVDILDDEGSVDFDEREQSWKTEGWGGYSTVTQRADFSSSDTTVEEGVIPVVEEELRVGKRDVNLGRVRVRSYVVEEPVQEEVDLASEHVVVERHATDRVLSEGETAFQDRTIEAEEHAEEAVVDKRARVKEEISIRKEREHHAETVSDTVRRTEVEVDDQRVTPSRGTGTSDRKSNR